MKITSELIVDDNTMELDEIYDIFIREEEESRKFYKNLDYSKLNNIMLDNDLDEIELIRCSTDYKIEEDDIFVCCPMCMADGYTFKANMKTKKYYCSNCKDKGDFEVVYDKQNPTKIHSIKFTNIGECK